MEIEFASRVAVMRAGDMSQTEIAEATGVPASKVREAEELLERVAERLAHD